MNAEVDEITLPFLDTVEAPAAPLRDRLRQIDWSYSKRNQLEQCPRKYYFDYFGGSARTAKSEPNKVIIRKLRSVQNRHERAGKILHLVIARYFRSARADVPLEETAAVHWALKLFDADLEWSRSNGGELGQRVDKYPPAQLLEFFHRQANAEELCAEVRKRLEAALRTFFVAPALAKIRATRGHESVCIEKKFRLLDLPCRVSGVVDFAACTQTEPGIVDWKIGEAEGTENESLQLSVYALWGALQFGCLPSNVHVFKAHLASGRLVPFRTTEDSLSRVPRRLRQDAKRMLEMSEYGRSARMVAFTPCAQPRVCALCRYLTICEEGKAAVQ